MLRIITIVEGYGEVYAMRVLLQKLVDWETQGAEFPRPKNALGKFNLKKPGGLERFLELARRDPPCDGILILVDADDECPIELASDLAERARGCNLPFPIAVVCAKCEYEAWFLASMETIAGTANSDIPAGTKYESPVEDKRGVKEWLSAQMPDGLSYKESVHQPNMTAHLDVNLAQQRSRSFRRLSHALQELLAGEVTVTPVRTTQ